MLGEIFFLLIGLVMILLAAEGFTNGIETLGRRFSLSQAVVGSLLAAVGTALPETILPIVAIFFYGGESAKDIGVGAILGAPFMLSTLTFFLVGITILVSYIKKRRRFEINVETHSTKRDLIFFLTMYSTAVLMPTVAGRSFSIAIVIILVGGYILYAYRTFRCEKSAGIEHSEVMYLWRLIRKLRLTDAHNPHIILIFLQVTGALFVMIMGAHTFVKSLEHVSIRFGMNPLLFALMLAPVATELPEKFNSIIWTWEGRDTLAIGNITGAMVFQSTFPVSVGLLFTEWRLTGMAFFSAIIAITSASIVFGELVLRKRLSPITLFLGGGLYLIYAVVLVTSKI
ncbi:MAG: sodium:calcium antiporter [Nitrospirae bacterium CG_4_10_14_0_8_um_filter_41_23]|nr:sodium:calcium antiporter [Nitrospirota bacterium]OIP60668.1 MAG: sodium:calcium antiporter [Nitrospirae bacterium CG2_30_41_42]PIQ93076.1 MAG: sodium:calcium antiporter [Nitrospirae bacterium CG11_big_fil_rev_8_21_14_0_20_41_14]PIV43772.1 MAG: sodium:calcium antiporter [Nitrospirae bacterium CG02_land_8_20_14_3_00_41_53]PIW87885.1 MAG: sodium:calcium antiporter [Nitrospirae bacterium CG_4_8_14_3_um_filter_41_47]PIY86622.1 MAG: sodium:calcium antiporter [Nitrospirae bacterium CG_4_10_14_0_8